jgi:micrococcal nuclease
VENGYARSATFPPDVARSGEFRHLAEEARSRSLGLWSLCGSSEREMETESVGGCNIKGNISLSGERIFHVPECEYYADTRIDEKKGERWFCSEDEAVSAGWRKALNCS